MLENVSRFVATLEGFAPLLLQGVWVTLKLALLSLLLGLIFGLLGAGAKLSRVRAWRVSAQAYTTLIRGVPDLVLMLLFLRRTNRCEPADGCDGLGLPRN